MSDPGDFNKQHEEYERQIYDLRQLLEISKSLNSTLEFHRLIESILYSVMGQMKVLRAAVYAKRGIDTPYFSLHRNFKGFEVNHDVDYSIPESSPAVMLFAREHACYTLDEVRSRLGGSLGGLEAMATLEPSLIVPLKAKGAVNGILILGERIVSQAFTDEERRFVLDLAVLAAIAIHNAWLFELTTIDMMTKLRMKHYFYTVLIEKMEQSGVSDRPLSVIMLDIDFFKRFNDTYGHTCGDLVLKNVAKIVQSCIRQNDVAARYGGEEFCVLLPETDLGTARVIAERIRASVEHAITPYGERKLAVTVSLGAAQFDPLRDPSAKAIIDRADRALYRSKQEGRNRVSVAG